MISVVLATFNRAALLPRAIASLTAQTCREWELVVVDDGSNDGTAELMARQTRADSRIRYCRQANTGLVGARNAGISMSQGGIITFLDSDDEYLPGHLALRSTHLAANPSVDMLHGGVLIVGGADRVPDLNRPGHTIAIADCFVGGTFFMRRHVAADLRGFRKPDFGCDHEFMTRALGRHRVEKVEWATYVYHRDQPDSMCNLQR